jgi:hypothetical protein
VPSEGGPENWVGNFIFFGQTRIFVVYLITAESLPPRRLQCYFFGRGGGGVPIKSTLLPQVEAAFPTLSPPLSSFKRMLFLSISPMLLEYFVGKREWLVSQHRPLSRFNSRRSGRRLDFLDSL